MELMHGIAGRRSIRKYTPVDVDDTQVRLLLEAAMAAPSAGNQQSWRFIVLREEKIKAAVAAVSPHAAMLPSAPVGIVICGDLEAEKHPGSWVQDCSAAVENLLLAAHGMGLGAVWLGYYPVRERYLQAQKILGLPDNILPLAVVSLGHPAEEKAPAARFDAAKVCVDRWGTPWRP